jgi:hypothetical protein
MSPRFRTRTIGIGSLLMALVLLPACGDDDDGDTGGGDTGDGTVSVTLQEFAVAADPGTAPAGSVTFDVSNIGPDDPHEFVVIKTDLGPTELPVGDDGAVLEDGEGMEVIDEIEDIPVGDAPTLTVDLEAGSYALICNIVEEEDGELESHYAEGMRTGFTVE